MGASLYEPINVYKPVASDIGIVDGPFEYLTVGGIRLPLPFTTRMTVVRLSNGDLFLHSPVKFDGRLAKELHGLGMVRHLVSPNQFHYAHIGEWARAFSETISWASPRVRQRARARHVDIDFTRDLDASAPEEWRGEIDQLLFPGGYFKEFIFFHKASRTLILTDTIINIELDKISEPWRTGAKLSGMYHPYGQIFFGIRLRYSSSGGRRRRRSERSTHGSRSEFCSAMAAALMQMPMKSSEEYSEGRPIEAVSSFNQILSKNFSVSDPSINKPVCRGHTGVRGLRMRVIVVSAILAAFLPLGGCFHHTQAVSVEPLSTPSIK
jgi:hypothetical protein